MKSCRIADIVEVLMFRGAGRGVDAETMLKRCRVQVQRSRGAEVQRSRGAEVQKCRGAKDVQVVQICIYGGDEVLKDAEVHMEVLRC